MNALRDSLPNRPCLHRSYHVLPVPGSEEIQLQSEGRTLRLQPRSSSDLLKRLLPLLDGNHTINDIQHALKDFNQSQVLDSLQQLYNAHLLEDGTLPPLSPLATDQHLYHTPQVTFFSHFSNEPHALQAHLATSQVVVVGLGVVGSQLLNSLSENGIGQLVGVAVKQAQSKDREDLHNSINQQCLSQNPWAKYQGIDLIDDDLTPLLAPAEKAQLLIVALDSPNPVLLDRVNEVCLRTGVVWLPIGIRAWEAYVGPTIIPHQTACYKCFDLRRKANLTHYESYLLYEEHLRTRKENRVYGSLPQFSRIVADITATEVVKLLTRFTPPTTYARMFTLDYLTLTSQFHDILKLPRCPACGEPSKQMPMMKPWYE